VEYIYKSVGNLSSITLLTSLVKKGVFLCTLLILFLNLGCSSSENVQSAERLYRATCSACHLIPDPSKIPIEKFTDQIALHKKDGRITLTDKEEEDIISYIKEIQTKTR
jgi:hypothetical protein